jgi:exodeoxyribonuclease VII small subunit
MKLNEKGFSSMEKNAVSFEDQLQQLELLVRKLDAEDVPLEDAIKYYEEGIQLSARLNKVLDTAQRRVEILSNKNGETQTESFPEEENLP